MQPETMLLLVAMVGVLLLLSSRSRRQQREAQRLQASLTVGVRIMTTAGLYATVIAVDGQVVTLETGPGQHSQWDSRAVARVLPVDDESTEPEPEPESEQESEPEPEPEPESEPEAPVSGKTTDEKAEGDASAPPDRA